MGVIGEAIQWLTDPVNWAGDGGIPHRMLEHMEISGLTVLAAALIAIPAGLAIGHSGRGRFLVVSLSNVGRAIPSFAILALALPITIKLGLGLGFWPTFFALFALAVPPILTNTYVGVAEVDRDLVEAARGMGMADGQILRRLELRLAAPVIMVGLRTAAVEVVATATLAALVAWGGLGRFIIDGFAVRDDARILGGAILVAVLAIATELVLGGVERLARPRTVSVRA
ncbi:MAG TPA: ABC transporter permease [Actinomycetota bacterium]|nr:ABC transporter permease [Actinomycetota bacterium]